MLKTRKRTARSVGLAVFMAASSFISAQAGIFTNNFDVDVGAATLGGVAVWKDSGGVDGTPFVSVTDALNGQQGVIVLPEIDPGEAIGGFKADFMVRIGEGTARAADGMAFVFGPEVDEFANFGEEGMGTGLVLSFDTWDNNGTDTAPALDVKVGGIADANIVSTTYLGGQREGGRARPGPIFTDPVTGAEVDLLTGGQWVPVSIEVRNGLLNLQYKGYQLARDIVVPFAAVPGRFAFGARTGDANANHWIDNLRIETFPRTEPSLAGVKSTATGFTISLEDSPNSAVTANTVNVTVDGAPVTVTTTKTGTTTTISYAATAPFASGSVHPIVLKYKHGTAGVDATVNMSYTVPTYTTLPATAALPAGSVDTTKTGFLWRIHQADATPALPTTLLRTEQQLAGAYGDNIADPNAVGNASGPAAEPMPTTAPIEFIIPGVINNVDPTTGAGGVFSVNATDPNFMREDAMMPGIPGLLGGDESFAVEILTALEFPAAGSYTMIVNSDDGFRTTAGRNPRDRSNPVLGQADVGRGPTDTIFNIYVEAPGIYPFRTIYNEGGGGAAIEWSTESGGTPRALINDTSSPQAIKAYLIPTSALVATVIGTTPANGTTSLKSPATVTAVIADPGNTFTTGSVALTLNGQSVTATATRTGSEVHVSAPVSTPLTPGAVNAQLTFGTANYSWSFNVGPFNGTIFVIEAEDWNYSDDGNITGGKTNPRAGEEGLDVNVMPYMGGAYDTLGAVEGIDYNNDDGNDANNYRTETDPNGENEVNISTANGAAPGNGSGGNIPIGSNDRINWTSTSNYRIGWVGGADWMNYTRVFPSNGTAGWWRVYAALSYDGNADGQLSGSLLKVTSPVDEPGQTTELLGSFSGPGSGGWGLNNLVPMRTAAGAPAVIKLAGLNTVRFNMGSGDFDFLIFVAAAAPPPFVESAPQDSVKRSEAIFDWVLRDTDALVNASTVKVFIDDQDVTSSAVVTKTDTGATIHLDLTGGAELTAGSHTYRITFSDNSSPAQNVTATGTVVVNPYPAEGVFVIEAEDFNYSDDGNITGGKTNPMAGEEGMDVNVMPYYGGAYNGLGAVEGIDYNNNDGNDAQNYRTETDENGENEVNIAPDTGSRYAADRGTFTVTSNFKIGWVEDGSWQNYTRTFPQGEYNVWAALSFDGRAAGQLRGSLDLVTSNPAAANQTVSRLGNFSAPGSGGWGRNELVQMRDANGAVAKVTMGGTQTVRFNLGSGDFDYLLFVPTATVVPPPQLTVSRSGSTLTVTWTNGGTLEQADAVTGPWTSTGDSDGSYTTTIPAGAGAKFYRVKR